MNNYTNCRANACVKSPLSYEGVFLLGTETSSNPSNNMTANIDEVEMTEIKSEPKEPDEYCGSENADMVNLNTMKGIIKGRSTFILEYILV